MNYQISRAGQTIGTYDIEALKAAVLSGQVLATDLAWTQGMPEWKSVSIVLAGESVPLSQGSAISAERIRTVASNHRAMNLCLLVSILAAIFFIILGGAVSTGLQGEGSKAGAAVTLIMFAVVFYALLLALFVFWCIKVYKLADALQAGPAFLWVLGMFVPCLSYVFVLILSQKAGNFLKANGVKVGFLGADSSTLP
ncbi:MAG: DUF4339 domain-containing protein [Verrucomicrobiota bacterium]